MSASPEWHAYRDSEAAGVRRVALGNEPVYDDDNLPAALLWASVARWGCFYLIYASRDTADAELDAFRQHAARLGYRLSHIVRGRGDRTWRFRVEAIQLVQLRLPFETAA